MDRNRLDKLLADLRAELTDARGLDEQSRASLRQLAEDVGRLATSAQPAPERHATAIEELENTALRFETEHPRLASVLGQVMDALGRMGI